MVLIVERQPETGILQTKPQTMQQRSLQFEVLEAPKGGNGAAPCRAGQQQFARSVRLHLNYVVVMGGECVLLIARELVINVNVPVVVAHDDRIPGRQELGAGEEPFFGVGADGLDRAEPAVGCMSHSVRPLTNSPHRLKLCSLTHC